MHLLPERFTKKLHSSVLTTAIITAGIAGGMCSPYKGLLPATAQAVPKKSVICTTFTTRPSRAFFIYPSFLLSQTDQYILLLSFCPPQYLLAADSLYTLQSPSYFGRLYPHTEMLRRNQTLSLSILKVRPLLELFVLGDVPV